MLFFPTNIQNPSYPLKVKAEDTSISSKFEDGTMQSRRKFTRSRKVFTLQWNSLSQSEYAILEDFIVNDVHFAAEVFKWINPVDNKTYEVRCTSYGDAELTSVNYWKIEIQLTEV